MKKLKTFLIWFVLIGVLFALLTSLNSGRPQYHEPFSRFLEHAHAGLVEAVRVNENEIVVTMRGTHVKYATLGVIDGNLTRTLSDQGVLIAHGETSNPIWTVLGLGVPLVLLVALLWYFVRKGSGNTQNIFSLAKSKARLVTDKEKVTFADVGGCAEAKEQLGDVIDFLKHSKRWVEAGARIPRGVLLEGPPGCGKTLLARAVAGETSAKFFSLAASEFVEMFVGVGAARVRDLFETAAKQTPAVIFIDELDAVGRRRGSGIGGSHDEREQTLNQLLVSLDGFEKQQQVVVIAATNRPDILDQALLRPGRIDRRIRIPSMSREARLETLRIHTRNKPLAPDVSLDALADKTDGLNGAEIEQLANEAAILAVRRLRNDAAGNVSVRADDFAAAMQSTKSHNGTLTKLDAVLIESTQQLAEPTGRAHVRLSLDHSMVLEGAVVWVDASFIKIRAFADGRETIVPKQQIRKIETLEGTEAAGPGDVVVDGWAGRHPDVA